MINIKVSKHDGFITEVTIKGHSGYDELGKDIVCASVSSISITTINACIRLENEKIQYEEKDGFLDIKVKENSRVINILMNNMIDLFKNLEEDYPNYIKITFK